MITEERSPAVLLSFLCVLLIQRLSQEHPASFVMGELQAFKTSFLQESLFVCFVDRIASYLHIVDFLKKKKRGGGYITTKKNQIQPCFALPAPYFDNLRGNPGLSFPQNRPQCCYYVHTMIQCRSLFKSL